MTDTTTAADQRYTRIENTFEMEVDGHVVIVDRATEQMITVNEVAGVIWNQLATPCTLDDIVAACATLYPDVDSVELSIDVGEFLAAAAASGLVRVEQ